MVRADKRFARLSWECAEGVLGEVNIGVGGFSDLLLGCGRCLRGICAWLEGVDCDGAEEGGDARPLNGSASRSQRPCLVRVACGVYQTKPNPTTFVLRISFSSAPECVDRVC